MRKPFYPRELFSIRQDQTQRNLGNYDRMVANWYDAAEKLFPDYFKMGLRERMEKRKIISDYVGYEI